MNIQPHQQRVIDEKRELDGKREKLEAFFKTPMYESLDGQERKLLAMQANAMDQYSSILEQRINTWGNA